MISCCRIMLTECYSKEVIKVAKYPGNPPHNIFTINSYKKSFSRLSIYLSFLMKKCRVCDLQFSRSLTPAAPFYLRVMVKMFRLGQPVQGLKRCYYIVVNVPATVNTLLSFMSPSCRSAHLSEVSSSEEAVRLRTFIIYTPVQGPRAQ